MLDQNCYGFIQIGLCIRLLRNVIGSASKAFVIGSLDILNRELQNGNFEVTLAFMNSTAYRGMEEDLGALENDEDEIGEEQEDKIREVFTTMESVVFAESSIKKIYVLPSRRFNTEYLLHNPEKLLSDGIYEKLDEIARRDINSACRCLLFGEATASAFHILRATESVLKSYYFHHRRKNRLNKPMWGNMVEQLKEKTRHKPPITLLNALDLVRTAYRNPTQHPQASYEIDSAQDLFGVCLDVIGKMGTEL